MIGRAVRRCVVGAQRVDQPFLRPTHPQMDTLQVEHLYEDLQDKFFQYDEAVLGRTLEVMLFRTPSLSPADLTNHNNYLLRDKIEKLLPRSHCPSLLHKALLFSDLFCLQGKDYWLALEDKFIRLFPCFSSSSYSQVVPSLCAFLHQQQGTSRLHCHINSLLLGHTSALPPSHATSLLFTLYSAQVGSLALVHELLDQVVSSALSQDQRQVVLLIVDKVKAGPEQKEQWLAHLGVEQTQ